MKKSGGALALLALVPAVYAQNSLTWNDVQARFLARNPSLAASALNVDEAKANQITAGLRPNPQFSLTADQLQFYPGGDPFRPLANIQFLPTVSQLWERGHKRQLRVDSAMLGVAQAQTDTLDVRRTLLFNLRDAFNRALTAKALAELARANLDEYNRGLELQRQRFSAGDLARVDYTRLELQVAQFESDLSTAQVNLRTAKIDLLTLLNDHTPPDQFDVTGPFDFAEGLPPLNELEDRAMAVRPDLSSAETAIRRAEADHKLAIANGTWDPTLAGEYLWNPQVHNTIGVGISVPLRIFDKNQGEKARTVVEVERTRKLRDQVRAAVLHDVDAAYEQALSVRSLLTRYRDRFLTQSADARDVVSFSYQHGGASLLDYLDAQKSYRETQQAYRLLIGNYLTAIAQLNLAVGEEAIR